MRIKNLRGSQWRPILKKLASFTPETSKNHLIRNFLRNGRLRVNVSPRVKRESQTAFSTYQPQDPLGPNLTIHKLMDDQSLSFYWTEQRNTGIHVKNQNIKLQSFAKSGYLTSQDPKILLDKNCVSTLYVKIIQSFITIVQTKFYFSRIFEI